MITDTVSASLTFEVTAQDGQGKPYIQTHTWNNLDYQKLLYLQKKLAEMQVMTVEGAEEIFKNLDLDLAKKPGQK